MLEALCEKVMSLRLLVLLGYGTLLQNHNKYSQKNRILKIFRKHERKKEVKASFKLLPAVTYEKKRCHSDWELVHEFLQPFGDIFTSILPQILKKSQHFREIVQGQPLHKKQPKEAVQCEK